MPAMRTDAAVLCFALLVSQPWVAARPDIVAAARQAYNAGDYDTAVERARAAMEDPKTAPEARIVLGRALLERFRRSSEAQDLEAARAALLEAGSSALTLPCARIAYTEDQTGLEVTIDTTPAAAITGPSSLDRLKGATGVTSARTPESRVSRLSAS